MYVYRFSSLLLSMYVCFVLFPLFDLSFVDFPSVLWYCWLGLLTCKNRLPYNLYCVGGDVKHCYFSLDVSRTASTASHRLWFTVSLHSPTPPRRPPHPIDAQTTGRESLWEQINRGRCTAEPTHDGTSVNRTGFLGRHDNTTFTSDHTRTHTDLQTWSLAIG